MFLKKVKVNHLKLQNSIEAFGGSYEDWQRSGIGADLLREQSGTEGEPRKWEWHTNQLEKAREFLDETVEEFKELWKTSSFGWGLKIGFGERDKAVQQSLRRAVFESYDAYDPNAYRCWCPLIREVGEERKSQSRAFISTQKHAETHDSHLRH